MNIRLLSLLALVSLSSVPLLALDPGVPVPDSGSTIGALAVGLIALIAIRRKLAK